MPRRNPTSGLARGHDLRILAVLCLLATAIIGQPRVSAREDSQTLEYPVKAAFLLNFTKFIEWPSPAKTAQEASFNLCILGDDPFGSILDQTVRGESVEGRRLEVKRVNRESLGACNIVYVSKSEKAVSEILKAAGPEVLTVGEGENFLRDGGMIAFIIENRRVRFGVRLATTRESALRFSSRLLSVARLVEN